MKRIFFIAAALIFSTPVISQDITGNWQGKLDVQGTMIPVIFHIVKDSNNKYSATFDSPDQKAFNLACSGVMINKDSVILLMKMINGKYAGRLSEDKKQLTGTWFQGGGSLPLTVIKTSDKVTLKKINRPQTPKPPFPYRSEEVEYDNADKTIHFGATFTVPLPDPGVDYFRAPIYPVVLMITGSGKQDRDETIFDHKPFAVIADHLSRNGIAVLRIDDRDIGKTTGNFSNATTADFAKDIEAGIDYLRSRKDVDTSNIGLLGHSEGGMIAPMVAGKRNDIKFIVLLAGPGVKIAALMEQQSIDVAATRGLSYKKLEQYRPLYRELISTIISEKDTALAKEKAVVVFKNWQKDKSESLVKNTTGVTNEKSLVTFTNGMVTQLNQPWFNYFIKFNPADHLSLLKCAVLALNGEKDIQVSSKPNLSAIKNALEKSRSVKFSTQEIAGLNHLFQHCKKCSVEEYGELEETFAPEVLEIIVKWIKQVTQ